MVKFKKAYSIKIISVIISVVFLFTSTTYGIDLPRKSHLRAPLLGNSQESTDRFKEALFYQIREILGRIVEADNEKDLEFYGETKKALLLESGRILLNKELYAKYKSGDLKQEREALQVIIYEIAKTLLQVIEQKSPRRYDLIKERAFNHLVILYRATNQGKNSYRDKILANDIWAVICEHKLMGINPEEVEDINLRTLLTKGYDIIRTNGLLFGEEFNSLYKAKETAMEALRKKMRFHKVASKNSQTDVETKTDVSIVQPKISKYAKYKEIIVPSIALVFIDNIARLLCSRLISPDLKEVFDFRVIGSLYLGHAPHPVSDLIVRWYAASGVLLALTLIYFLNKKFRKDVKSLLVPFLRYKKAKIGLGLFIGSTISNLLGLIFQFNAMNWILTAGWCFNLADMNVLIGGLIIAYYAFKAHNDNNSDFTPDGKLLLERETYRDSKPGMSSPHKIVPLAIRQSL